MPSEFLIPPVVAGLLLLGLFLAADPSICLAQASANQSTDETDDPTNPLIPEFRRCDTDKDGLLTEAEYDRRIGFSKQDSLREFLVFDANGDARISLNEFLTVPVGQPDEQRGTITDPVIVLSRAKMADLAGSWKQWDQNADGVISGTEFVVAKLASRVTGLEATQFADWDLNRDGNVSRDEVARVLDVAFGVCVPGGVMLRSRTGRIVDWGMFLRLKTDANGIVTRNDYFQALGQTVPDPEAWLQTIDKNKDGRFDIAEFSTGGHRIDPVGTFLSLDVDLNGKVSRAELAVLPVEWRQMALVGLRAFDDNADGELSLREYQLMPHSNIVASWSTANDTNNDGMLSVDEFQFQKGVPLAAITREYFRRLDLNANQRLTLDEWPFQTNHPEARFRLLDKDSDGSLTEVEFTAEGSLARERLSRDFRLLDANHDNRMDLSEFFTFPYWIPGDQRGAIADPVVMASDDRFKELTSHWGEWDRNADDQLNAEEFRNATIGQRVRGLESTRLGDWDVDRNGKVSREEVKSVLEIAFGVRTPEGKLLRSPSGRVVDWVSFRQLRLDGNGFVSREVYFQLLGNLSDAQKATWIQGTDQNHDGKFNYDEFALSDHRTDPLVTFMHLDADLNGRLTMNELTNSPHEPAFAKFLFPGFDDDQDGALSLQEYQLTPMVNLLASWQAVRDTDGDGRLSREEFRFLPGIPLAALSAEYFRRFDKDQDNSLTSDEFPFASELWEICVTFADDTRKLIGIPGYAIVCSPEISPDARWIAVDGWKSGQSNVTAHIFTVHVETKEVRDLGIGCIPNWSADGRRIALSKYGRGVFIRDFEGTPAREESIDPEGWAIMFSPDGLKTAYVKQGNLVVHTLKTGEKKSVFPHGKSPYTDIEHNFTWSPSSDRLCFKGHRANGVVDIGIVSASGDDPKLRIRCDGRTIQSDFAWLSDGKRLMFPYLPTGGGFIQTYSLDPEGDDDPIRYPRQPEDKHTGGLCWSRDGKTFVFMCKR